jgi:hypothetical protein
VRKKAPKDVVTIFILPPSMEELRSRLERRAEDAPEVIAKRLDNARNEIARWQMYDYIVVNDDLQRALGEVKAILIAERVRRTRSLEAIDDLCQSPAGSAVVSRKARASAANPAISISSARAVGLMPAASSSAAASMPSPFRDCLSILRRWPNAACVTRESAPISQGRGVLRGTSSTTEDVTFGGGVKAAGGRSNRMRACVRQPASTPRRP